MRILAFCLLILLAGPAPQAAGSERPPPEGAIRDTSSGEAIDAEALARDLSGADIVILGEVHDNALHHRAQAWLIARLRPAGIALEMIRQESEPAIAAHLAAGGVPDEIGDVVNWAHSGWPDWELYRPIFEAWAPELYTGGGLTREVLREAATGDPTALVPDPRFAPILARDPDPATRAELEDEMIAAHCDRLPREAASAMVGMQRLRDAALADAALRAHEAGGPTVLIAGNGHARTDRGVPAFLAEVEPDLTVLSVALLETDTSNPAPASGDAPYDFVWITAPTERPDPCKEFRAPE